MSAWADYMNRAVGDDSSAVIADKVGVNPAQVSRWRRNQSSPSHENAIQFAVAYGKDHQEALIAAGFHVGRERLAEVPSTPDPSTTIPAMTLLKYVAHVVEQTRIIRGVVSDRETLSMAAMVDRLSTGVLLACLAGAERPVPKHVTEAVEALTQYIHGSSADNPEMTLAGLKAEFGGKIEHADHGSQNAR